MDLLYMLTVAAIWCMEFLIAKHLFDYAEEKKSEYEKTHNTQQEQRKAKIISEIVGGLCVPIGIGLLALPIWVISMLQSDAQQQLQKTQWANCENAQTAEGEYLTKAQCEYFRDVMSGKYSDTTYYVREFDD